MKRRILSLVLALCVVLTVCNVNVTVTAASKGTLPTVYYRAHVSGIGWQKSVKNKATAGVIGKDNNMEAITLSVKGVKNLGITYRTRGDGYGWQSWVKNGTKSGTTGMSKSMQAIQISLTGKAAKNYDVYYKVYVNGYGWLDWAKNGKTAGTVGLSLPIQGIKVSIVKKGSKAPGPTTTPSKKPANIYYKVHGEGFGWQDEVKNGAVAGTVGEGKRIEAIQISTDNPSELGVSYRVHVQDDGWVDAVSDGATAGTVGQSKRIEAIMISLTGSDKDKYNIWYRVHIQNYGWLGWASNGAQAGSSGMALRVEAIQIKLLPKASPAPGSTDKAFVQGTVAQMQATSVLNKIGWNLRAAYNYSAGLKYYRYVPVPASGQHLETYASYGFTNGCGNCYVMASTFCEMARLLGYEAYLVEGYVPSRFGGITIHGWCELVINGKTYVFDPNFTNETGGNGYMITYGTSGTWVYQKYSRVN